MVAAPTLTWLKGIETLCLRKQHSIKEVIKYIAIFIEGFFLIKTSGSESRGQEEAACVHVFGPMRPLQ